MENTYGFAFLTAMQNAENIPKAKRLFHELWTKAVGQPDYDKKQWQELDYLLNVVLGPY